MKRVAFDRVLKKESRSISTYDIYVPVLKSFHDKPWFLWRSGVVGWCDGAE